MARLALLVLAVSSTGCTYLANRGRDFADVFRLEGSVGIGLDARVSATELCHVGAGSSRRFTAGLFYGEVLSERRVEDHFPLSYVYSLLDSESEALHSLRWGTDDAAAAQHRCYVIFPGEFNRSTWERSPLHYWDVEAGVFAAVIGVEIGISLGELVDFLIGLLTTYDIAGDDGYDNRLTRKVWRRVSEASTDPTRGK